MLGGLLLFFSIRRVALFGVVFGNSEFIFGALCFDNSHLAFFHVKNDVVLAKGGSSQKHVPLDLALDEAQAEVVFEEIEHILTRVDSPFDVGLELEGEGREALVELSSIRIGIVAMELVAGISMHDLVLFVATASHLVRVSIQTVGVHSLNEFLEDSSWN